MFSLFQRKKSPLSHGSIREKNFKEQLSFRDDGGLILIDLTITNHTYTFMLDSGAFSVVPSSLLELGVLEPLEESIYTRSTTKVEQESQLYRLSQLSLAGIHFEDFSVIVDDFAYEFPLSCLGFDGILGYNFLEKFILEIDYQKKSLILSDTLSDKREHTEIKLHINETNAPSFKIAYKKKSYLVGLDSGKNDGLMINDTALIKELENSDTFLERIMGTFSSDFNGLNQHSFIDKYLFKDFKIDGKIPIESATLLHEEGSVNIAGNEFLSHFHIILHLQKKRLYLRKLDASSEVRGREDFGFITFWSEEKRLFIAAIVQGSPAYHSKLKIGDKIMSINELDTLNFSQEEYCKHTLRSKRVMLYDEDDTELSIIVKRDGKLIREQLSLSL